MKNLKSIIVILTIAIAFAFLAATAEAKWWIFGQSEDDVTIHYININNLSIEDAGPKITLFRDTLPNGLIYIRGKASVKSGKIGSVRITKDNKQTWEEAILSSDTNTFQYFFRPEIGKSYVIFVEVTDTRGKTNRVDDTRKEVIVSDMSIQPAIREVLDNLIAAYCSEDGRRFMSFVSENFVGDYSSLERAIKKDFSAFDNISLRYSINNISTDPKGRVYVSLNYARMVTSTRSGQTLNDTGTTEFIFVMEDRGPRIYNMKLPLIFGVSDPSLATGYVNLPTNTNVIVITPTGGVTKVSMNDLVRDAGSGGGAVSGSKTASLTSVPTVNFESFSFSDGSVTTEVWGSRCTGNISGDFGVFGVNHHMTTKNLSIGYIDLGVKSIDSISSVPTTGYLIPSVCGFSDTKFLEGHSYAFKLRNNAYGLIEVTGFSGNRMNFKYKYSSNGPFF